MLIVHCNTIETKAVATQYSANNIEHGGMCYLCSNIKALIVIVVPPKIGMR